MRHNGVKYNPKRQTAKFHANTHGLISRHTCSKASTRLFLKALLSYQTSSTDTVDQTSAVVFVAVFSKTSRFVGYKWVKSMFGALERYVIRKIR